MRSHRIAIALLLCGGLAFMGTASQAAGNPPGAPQAVTATRANNSAVVAWDAPADAGDSAITGYVVSARSGDFSISTNAGAAARSATVTGLANGVTYGITVVARNSNCDSGSSTTVTVQPSKTAAKVPSAPVISQVIAGSQSLILPYSLGADNGSTIFSTEWSIDGGVTWTLTTTSPVQITGLTNGKSYPVKLRSRNRVGYSAAASKSGKPMPAKNYIDFAQPANMNLDDPRQSLTVASTGGATVVTSTTPKICTIDGSVIVAIAVGTCKLTASNAGDAFYAAATVVNRSVTVTALPPGKVLLWSDEFKGTAGATPSSTGWTADVGDGCGGGNCGWGNNERQYYTTAANRLDGTSDGNLVINATREGASAYRCYYGTCGWTSGKLTTYGKVGFTYGQLEARVKIAAGGGTWPAFWLLGSNIATVGWPRCGEIDVFEGVGNLPYKMWGTAHMADNNGARILRGGTTMNDVPFSDGYHIYDINWTPTSITWSIDRKPYFTANKSDFGYSAWPFGPLADGSAPRMFLILNLAMGGDMGGGISNGLQSTSMTVDWVRYYKINGVGAVTTK